MGILTGNYTVPRSAVLKIMQKHEDDTCHALIMDQHAIHVELASFDNGSVDHKVRPPCVCVCARTRVVLREHACAIIT